MMRAELHCHSRYSKDGFNSIRDLIRECRRKQITVLAITDHDVMKVTRHDEELLRQNNIFPVPACEMETSEGIHLIGFFISSPLVGAPLKQTVDHILSQGGLISVPHPFKPETGLLAVSPLPNPDSEYVLHHSHFIERFNGDWPDTAADSELRSLAKSYHLRVLAGSDAHTIWQIGRWANLLQFEGPGVSADTFRNASVQIQHLGPFLPVSKTRTPSRNPLKRLISHIRHWPPYRAFIRHVPFSLKRAVRELFHAVSYFRYKTTSGVPDYISIPEGELL